MNGGGFILNLTTFMNTSSDLSVAFVCVKKIPPISIDCSSAFFKCFFQVSFEILSETNFQKKLDPLL